MLVYKDFPLSVHFICVGSYSCAVFAGASESCGFLCCSLATVFKYLEKKESAKNSSHLITCCGD